MTSMTAFLPDFSQCRSDEGDVQPHVGGYVPETSAARRYDEQQHFLMVSVNLSSLWNSQSTIFHELECALCWVTTLNMIEWRRIVLPRLLGHDCFDFLSINDG
jgi:hypothetical protein